MSKESLVERIRGYPKDVFAAIALLPKLGSSVEVDDKKGNHDHTPVPLLGANPLKGSVVLGNWLNHERREVPASYVRPL